MAAPACSSLKSLALSKAILGLWLVSTIAELQRYEHPSNVDGSLSFLIIGDWGRRGTYNQTEVALQMGRIGEKLSINFVISTGIEDTSFEESFTKIYNAKSLQKQWYSVLGNHDYRGDVEEQLSPILRKIDSRWLCLRSFIVDAEIAEIFFVDTTPFVDKYFATQKDHVYDWKGASPREEYIANLLKDVDSALRESTARWKIVVGHHAIRSVGHHGDTKELVKQLLPILEANNIDLYMNGHDHCLEHISSSVSPIQFLTSGGGSKAWRGDVKGMKQMDGVKFYYDDQGFISVQVTQTNAKIAFYDVFGNVIHKWSVSK
uniref:Purple acid phosphatase n=1 Tax=Nelumbo nucifera TaxID=4432 RepID=A0A822YIG2_NELNU|nr:TPA_asm: hypothetical protein HUJ06_011168 [Nelumbo nucifera]